MGEQDVNKKYCQQFWHSHIFSLQNEHTSNREKADRLRSLMFFIHGQLVCEKVSDPTYQYLHKKLSDEYSHVVDCPDGNKGLNNYNEMISELTKEKKKDIQNWKSGLSFTEDRQSACISHLLKKAGTKKGDTKYMAIKFSNLLKEEKNSTQVKIPLVASSFDNNKTQKGFTSFLRQVESKGANNFSQDGKPASLHGKRKHTSKDVLVKHGNNVDEKENNGTRNSRITTITKSFQYQPGKNNASENNVVMMTSQIPQQQPALQQQPFLTAREQLVVDQKKKGNFAGSDSRNSISTTSYGSVKKSLGTRRGVNTKFVPPVHQEKVEKNVYNKSGRETQLDPKYENCEWMKNVDPKMIELIENEIMDNGPNVSWNDIAGLEFAKKTIQEIVIWPMLRPDIFTGLRGPPKGLLLFGPPGTGKTLIGKCIARHSNATFFSISASSLTSKWVGEGEKMVRALFGVARCHQPAVIFIDEIDSLLTQRSDSEHESSRRIKTEFLVQLDGATSSADDRLLVVGATNRPQELDEAARRRLVKRLYIPLPEDNARKQIIENLMNQQSNQLCDADILAITSKTAGFSGADMANLCREAALGPIRSISDIRNINANDVRPVILKDFEIALKVVRPSVSQKDLKVYVDWNLQFGSGGGEF